MSYIRKLNSKELISPPTHVVKGIQYEVMMGSVAYGVSTDTSDVDIYGFSIPYKEIIFPHLTGEINGFDKIAERFEQYQQHHIEDHPKEYDLTIYNIVKYFRLVKDNNPNMIDSLFVPRRCVLFETPVGEYVRSKRKEFLHKGAWHKFKRYAFSQLHKMKIKNPEGKRKELKEKYGYDTKFAYHIIRLLSECEQILTEHDIDLERNREQLKSIRRGEWTQERIENYFNEKERDLESVYLKSTLRYLPDNERVKQILLNCLEMHFGKLDSVVPKKNKTEQLITDIERVLGDYK